MDSLIILIVAGIYILLAFIAYAANKLYIKCANNKSPLDTWYLHASENCCYISMFNPIQIVHGLIDLIYLIPIIGYLKVDRDYIDGTLVEISRYNRKYRIHADRIWSNRKWSNISQLDKDKRLSKATIEFIVNKLK